MVGPNLERVFSRCAGRIVVTCFASNIHRVQQVVHAAAALDRKVADVMSSNLIICVGGDSIENAMHVMTQKRIRHLPILDGQRLVGILSIGDVVKAKLDHADAEIRFLRDYVSG
jgi:CBS domain-containing protein